MAENRLDRTLETRETEERPQAWKPPTTLPEPRSEEGYAMRWIRVAIRGEVDATNVSARLREGWEPCRAVDHPEIFLVNIENERFKDNILIGGLLLCKTPIEMVEQRNAYYEKQAEGQVRAVDNSLMRENDPRMPLFKEGDSEVTFGTGG
jgi:hypothetical protein|tara:strand:- start:7287 stop:7736 length:450 start_codon:yes stop_codon:yes gene_type:complete